MRFIHLETVTSTQDEVRALYQQGERGPLWVCAQTQTQGRGRRDRSWTSMSGNLFASGLYPTEAAPANSALYGFAAALAVSDTISAFDPQRPVTLKWPNDVLVGGAKISGILIEREKDALIVGTGLNLVSHPKDTPYPATHLMAEMDAAEFATDEPRLTDAMSVLPLLVAKIVNWFGILETHGFEPLRDEWQRRAHRLGETVSINRKTGIFTGLAEDGALCLQTPDGKIQIVHAGDVSFG